MDMKKRIESSEIYNTYKERYAARVRDTISKRIDNSDVPYADVPMSIVGYMDDGGYKTHEDTITGSKKTLIEKCKINARCINLDDNCAKFTCTRLLFEAKNEILDMIDVDNLDAALSIDEFVYIAKGVVNVLKEYLNETDMNYERVLFYIDTEIIPWLDHFILRSGNDEPRNATLGLTDVYCILKAVSSLELYLC